MASGPDPSYSSVVKVRCVDGSVKLNVIFNDSSGHYHELCRDKDEHVSKALTRIVLQSQKKRRNRKRKHGGADEWGTDVPIEAHLYTPTGVPVESGIPNSAAWEEGGVLEVGSARYQIRVNVPTILALTLPSIIMTDCPTVPKVTLPLTSSKMYTCPTIRGESICPSL